MSPIFVSTQAAALLTGKSVRTIHNWLESGVIMGKAVPATHIPGGQMWQIDLSSIAANVQTEMTDEFLECVRRADAGDAKEMNNVGTPRCQGSCRLSEMESGVGWGRKVDYRDETLLSRT